MSRYARVKQEITLFKKGTIPRTNEPYLITVPKGTIVQVNHWSSEYKLITVDSYNSVCRKTDLEFLDESS